MSVSLKLLRIINISHISYNGSLKSLFQNREHWKTGFKDSLINITECNFIKVSTNHELKLLKRKEF